MNPATAQNMMKSIDDPSLVKSAKEVLASTDTFDPEAGKASDTPFIEEITDEYDNLTVAELKELLKARGLSIAGVKADLIQRLRLDDANTSDSTEAPVEETAAEEEQEAPSTQEDAVTNAANEGEVSESKENSG